MKWKSILWRKNFYQKINLKESQSSPRVSGNLSQFPVCGALIWGLLYVFMSKETIKNKMNTGKLHFKGYLRYKTIISQNVPSEAQIKNFVIS